MPKREELELRIIQRWLKRPVGQRRMNDVLLFYAELEHYHPELLDFRYPGADKYQAMKSILRDHIEAE